MSLTGYTCRRVGGGKERQHTLAVGSDVDARVEGIVTVARFKHAIDVGVIGHHVVLAADPVEGVLAELWRVGTGGVTSSVWITTLLSTSLCGKNRDWPVRTDLKQNMLAPMKLSRWVRW
jgi:hypothetical protein